MAIPKHIIEEIKHSTRLSDVLGKYITLRRAGKEFQALCPFHKEKTPSFTVSDEKGFYHCFGCGAHGDAITFLMKHDHRSYVEAIKHLADQAGIIVPEETAEDRQQQEYSEILYDVMAKACHWFQERLNAEEGWAVREYITKRGLKPEIVSRFMLGYAPVDRIGLKSYLSSLGVSEQHMLDVGLLTKPDDGEPYDKFRSRLMFPIVNAAGKVIAFGGRLISDDPNTRAPKYLNSPETLLFKKRSQFYAAPTIGNNTKIFNLARDSGRLIVVEGYMDVIACVQAGLEEVVATLGTAFTEEHAKLLWRAVDEPVICLDGDSAGSRAMLRAAELAMPLLTPGKSLRFMLMPKGEDPDTLLKSQGKAVFEKLVNQAIPLHEGLFNAYASEVNMRDPTKRAGLEKQLERAANQVADPTVRQHMRRYFKEAMWQRGHINTQNGTVKAKPNSAIPLKQNPLEVLNKVVLKLFVSYPELLDDPLAEELLTRIDSQDHQLQELTAAIQAHMCGGSASTHSLTNHIQQKGLGTLSQQLQSDKSLILPAVHIEDRQHSESILKQWLDQLDRMNLEKEYQDLTSSMHISDASEEVLERMLMLQQEIKARKSS